MVPRRSASARSRRAVVVGARTACDRNPSRARAACPWSNRSFTLDAPIFTNRYGKALTGTAIRRLFDRLKVRTGIPDLCAHMLRHTWATNYNRSRIGSTFDLQVEGGWTTARMVDRYCKVRPLDERRRAPSPFTAPRAARIGIEKRPSEKGPSPQKSAPARRRLTTISA
jgi:integrase